MNEDHPAMKVARASWAAVQSHEAAHGLELTTTLGGIDEFGFEW